MVKRQWFLQLAPSHRCRGNPMTALTRFTQITRNWRGMCSNSPPPLPSSNPRSLYPDEHSIRIFSQAVSELPREITPPSQLLEMKSGLPPCKWLMEKAQMLASLVLNILRSLGKETNSYQWATLKPRQPSWRVAFTANSVGKWSRTDAMIQIHVFYWNKYAWTPAWKTFSKRAITQLIKFGSKK